MTIDPLTIPCAYCGNTGIPKESITTHGSFDVAMVTTYSQPLAAVRVAASSP